MSERYRIELGEIRCAVNSDAYVQNCYFVCYMKNKDADTGEVFTVRNKLFSCQFEYGPGSWGLGIASTQSFVTKFRERLKGLIDGAEVATLKPYTNPLSEALEDTDIL